MWRFGLAVILLAALTGCGGESGAEKYMHEGLVNFQQHHFDQAIASYEKAVKLEPKAAAAYNMLGMAYRFKYQETGNLELQDQEIAAFQKAIEVNPKFWVAMINLGITYYALGEKAKAAPLFKQALELNPSHPEKPQMEKMIAEGEKKA